VKGLTSAITLSCILLILAGCSQDRYSTEREYWQAKKRTEEIFKNPHASPPAELENVVGILNNFIQRHPDDRLSIEAEFNIARLYMVKEQHQKARTQLQSIITKYSKSPALSSEAAFLIGNSYEKEDKWSSAIREYKKIMRDYALTVRGLDIPVYIAEYYRSKYQPDKMIGAYREAIGHYRALANKHSNTPLAYNLDTLVARCYIAMKEWQGAIGTFNTMLEDYKGKVALDEVLLNIALIYNSGLQDKAKMKETLGQLIKDYPKSRYLKAAQALLNEVEKNERDKD